ncbi:MAG: (d)CMP kinase [Kiritimatiellae bacterium]|nr:(d)CMP kinase [Kiritimatiellia bacterium]
MPSIQVAIDGPSASGKSTVARAVARQLGFVYVDSGMFYRALTRAVLRRGWRGNDPAVVIETMRLCRWETRLEDGAVKLFLDGEGAGPELRTPEVAEAVSDVAAIPEVRRFIVARLRETRAFGPLVMEGRDIGTVVFPDAAFKFYLDADPAERARRRSLDIAQMGAAADVEDVRQSLERRDRRDRTRPEAPLQVALGAEVLDTTRMTVEEVVQRIVSRVRAGLSSA